MIFQPGAWVKGLLYSMAMACALCASATAPASISHVDKPVFNDENTVGALSEFYHPPGIKGYLVYPRDTMTYRPEGGPANNWENYFVIKTIGEIPKDHAVPLPVGLTSFKVHGPDYQMAYQPHFSPDGQYLSYKLSQHLYGHDPSTLHLLNLKTLEVTTVDEWNSYWPEAWSPDCRYVLFFRGDFIYGAKGHAPRQSWVYDRFTKKRSEVIQTDYYAGDAWLRNTLVYTGSRKYGEQVLSPLFLYDPLQPRPRTCLLDDALYPAPSPDGKRIAAFSGDTKGIRRKAAPSRRPTLMKGDQAPLKLFALDGSTPVTLATGLDSYSTMLLWSPNSKHLYIIARRDTDEKHSKVSVTEYTMGKPVQNRVTGSLVFLRGLQSDSYFDFQALKITNDNRYLIYYVSEDTPTSHNGIPDISFLHVKGMNLADGTSVDIAKVLHRSTVDWFDESARNK